jgi:hypothetical protein
MNDLFLFYQFTQTFSGIFAHGSEFGVGAVAFGEIGAIFLAQRFNKGIAILFADLTALIAFAAIKAFWIMFQLIMIF